MSDLRSRSSGWLLIERKGETKNPAEAGRFVDFLWLRTLSALT